MLHVRCVFFLVFLLYCAFFYGSFCIGDRVIYVRNIFSLNITAVSSNNKNTDKGLQLFEPKHLDLVRPNVSCVLNCNYRF